MFFCLVFFLIVAEVSKAQFLTDFWQYDGSNCVSREFAQAFETSKESSGENSQQSLSFFCLYSM